MKLKACLVKSFIVFITPLCLSQNFTHTLQFLPTFGGRLLTSDKYYLYNSKDSIQINELKFYISNIECWDENQMIWKEENSYHLIDNNDSASLVINFKLPGNIKFNTVRFYLGIDSITNVSGALGGALDPTKGMYWTWQSGYINFKLEGKSNLCNSRNNEFQFHLGGYQSPFSAIQKIILHPDINRKIFCTVDIKTIIDEIELSKQHHIMSPCQEAVTLAQKIAAHMNSQKN